MATVKVGEEYFQAYASTREEKDGLVTVFPNELNYFHSLPSLVGILESKQKEIHPTGNVEKEGEITFSIAKSEDRIDPGSTWALIKGRIVNGSNGDHIPLKKDGGADNPKKNVIPVNCLATALFKDVGVKLNGTNIDRWDHMYAHKSDMENRLGFPLAAKTGAMSISQFVEESRAFEDVGNDGVKQIFSEEAGAEYDPRDNAFISRYNMTKGSEQFHLLTPIHHGLFQQNLFLPPNTSLGLVFDRNKSKFYCLSNENNTYEFAIDTMHLLIRRIKTDAKITEDEEKLCKRDGMERVIPIRHVEMKYRTLSAATTEVQTEDLCGGVVPKRIYFGLVRAAAREGDLKLDPFNYQHYKTTMVSVRSEGAPGGLIEISTDFTKQLFYMALRQLLESNDSLYNADFDIGFNTSNYLLRNVLHGVKLSKSQTASRYGETGEKMSSGELTVHVKLDEPPGHMVSLICYMEYDAEIVFDSERAVSLRYYQDKKIVRSA